MAKRRTRMGLASTIIQSLPRVRPTRTMRDCQPATCSAWRSRASCCWCACRRWRSRWAPIRGSTPTSASASSPASLPYRDAWDQKPPAIHFTYALLRAVWPPTRRSRPPTSRRGRSRRRLLSRLGRARRTRRGGPASALLFLLLSNPALTRLGGVRLRSQGETFIALAVTAALSAPGARAARPAARAPVVRRGGAASGSRSCSSTTRRSTRRPRVVAVCGCGSD